MLPYIYIYILVWQRVRLDELYEAVALSEAVANRRKIGLISVKRTEMNTYVRVNKTIGLDNAFQGVVSERTGWRVACVNADGP